VHLFGFIIKNFVTMRGHMHVKSYKMQWGKLAWEGRSVDIRSAFWLGIGTYNRHIVLSEMLLH
jgi:hypothetical protein